MKLKKSSIIPIPVTQHSLADLKELALQNREKSKNQRKEKEAKRNKSSFHPSNMKKSSWISKLHKQIFNVSSSYLSKERNSIKSSVRTSSLSQFDKENNYIRNTQESKDKLNPIEYPVSILIQSSDVNLKNIKSSQGSCKQRNKVQQGLKYGRGSVDLSALSNDWKSNEIQNLSYCKNGLKNNREYQYKSDREFGGSLAESNIKKRILKLFETNIIPFLVDKFIEVEQKLKSNIRGLQQTVRKQNQQILLLKQNEKAIMSTLLSIREKDIKNGIGLQQNTKNEKQRSNLLQSPSVKTMERQIEEISRSIQKIIGKFDDQSEKIGKKLKQMADFIQSNKLELKSNFQVMEEQFGQKVLELINTYNENFLDLDSRIQKIQTAVQHPTCKIRHT